MTDDTSEFFRMVAKPKGSENAAIQLTQNIWKIEDALDMLFSYTKKGYETYKEEGESGILIKTDGTLICEFPSEKICQERFTSIMKKLVESKFLSTLQYDKLELETYKISKKIEGKLEDVAPAALITFLRKPKKEAGQKVYEPDRICYEFLDKESHINFIKINFNRVAETENLLLDVSVESNDVKYAKDTISQVQKILKK